MPRAAPRGILPIMSPDSPLRAWMALCAVLAVGATAVAIRPAAPRVAAVEYVTAGPPPLAGRAMPVVAAAPALRAAGLRELPAVRGVDRQGAQHVAPTLRRPLPTTPDDTAAAVSAGPRSSEEHTRESRLPARALVAWHLVSAVDDAGDGAPAAERGWASRTGDAIGSGGRSASRGLRTGVSAAGRALRRAF